jgi:hypothetical protein
MCIPPPLLLLLLLLLQIAKHLKSMLCNGASVEVRDQVNPLARKDGIIVEAHPDLLHYDLAYEDGTRENLLPAYRYYIVCICVCMYVYI